MTIQGHFASLRVRLEAGLRGFSGLDPGPIRAQVSPASSALAPGRHTRPPGDMHPRSVGGAVCRYWTWRGARSKAAKCQDWKAGSVMEYFVTSTMQKRDSYLTPKF